MERVLASERLAFEKKWNSSILYVTATDQVVPLPYNDTEYSPILFETDDENFRFVDSGAYPLYRNAIDAARDTGLFTLSPITPRRPTNNWQMGAYLAYYGPGVFYTSFSSVEARRNACIGYVGTVMNVTEVFSTVLMRCVAARDPCVRVFLFSFFFLFLIISRMICVCVGAHIVRVPRFSGLQTTSIWMLLLCSLWIKFQGYCRITTARPQHPVVPYLYLIQRIGRHK